MKPGANRRQATEDLLWAMINTPEFVSQGLARMALWKNCNGMTRRDALQLGLGTLFGGGLANSLLRSVPKPGMPLKTRTAAKTCILIWMDGGPTHYETFDPKPDAPSEIRGEFEPSPPRCPASSSPSI